VPSIQKIIGDNTHLIYSWDEAMHSRIDYIIYGNDISILEKASKEISDTLLQLENIGNRFNFKSEISTLNNCLSDKPVKVSEKLYFLLKEGKDIYNKSFGYFDMTIQSKTPEIDRWDHIFLTMTHIQFLQTLTT
jgi:Membrane-associated lipoprotein involved in thiamine biosynthesis